MPKVHKPHSQALQFTPSKLTKVLRGLQIALLLVLSIHTAYNRQLFTAIVILWSIQAPLFAVWPPGIWCFYGHGRMRMSQQDGEDKIEHLLQKPVLWPWCIALRCRAAHAHSGRWIFILRDQLSVDEWRRLRYFLFGVQSYEP